MSDPSPQQLLGHLLGALDEDEQDWLETRLERDSGYRRQWAQWCRRVAPLQAFKPDFEPPPGLAERTCRFVAAYRAGATPAPVPVIASGDYLTGSKGYLGWPDVAMLTVLVVMLLGAIFPAIQDSRLQARAGACQDRLRKVGQGLNDYATRRAIPVTQLAHDGQLTQAGGIAAQLLEGDLSGNRYPLITDAWWASQGVPAQGKARGLGFAAVPAVATRLEAHEEQQAGEPTVGKAPPVVQNEAVVRLDTPPKWPGTWRDGTANGPSTPSPAEMALLADAPSVDMPGQTTEYHGGLGRNLFFADGHVKAQRSAVRADYGELIELRGRAWQASPGAVPITFVNN